MEAMWREDKIEQILNQGIVLINMSDGENSIPWGKGRFTSELCLVVHVGE
jgi:hypothetical protein